MRLPTPRFLKEMGMASVLAGVVMLGVGHAWTMLRRIR